MKKKYICGIAAIVVVVIIAAISTVVFGAKYTLNVSRDEGYTVSLKDIVLDENGTASVKKGKQLVFAVTLDDEYSDSNVKVSVNNNELSAQKGVYRYTIDDKKTTVKVEGVKKNTEIISGVDVDPGTMDDMDFELLKDENGNPVPVLSDINLNGVDTYDVPDLELTASVSEAINPGWKFRQLSEVNIGKYAGLKFFVKNSNYLQAKKGDEEFVVLDKSDDWNEFFFKYEDGAINLYVNGSFKVNCNYLDDIEMCFQNLGTYKLSNIYVVKRNGYKGANVTVTEGDGYYVDVKPREYAIGSKIIFNVDIDEYYKKGSGFAVKANGQTLKEDSNGTYTFELKKDTQISVLGVVPKPLDSRYVLIDTPFFAETEVTTNYSLMNSIKGAKTYTFTTKTWTKIGMPEVNIYKYTDILFFMRKDDEDSSTWLSFMQTDDDENDTMYMGAQDNKWHRVELKKEGNEMYCYIDGEKQETPVIDGEHLFSAVSDNGSIRFTSMVGIIDKNYKEPAPDYLSSKYKVIDMPVIIDAKTISNYELVKKVKGAKTYKFVPETWCSLAFNTEVNLDKYKELVFFVHKEDMKSVNWIVFSKKDASGNEKNFIATNNNRWYKVELKKVTNGKFNVFINGKQQDETVASVDELRLTFNEKSEVNFTSLMGIKDSSYKEPKPDYLSSKYKTIGSPIAVIADKTENYTLMKNVKDSVTYKYNVAQWQKVGFTDVNFDAYKDLVFFIHKEDRSIKTWVVLQNEDSKGNVKEAYIQSNDTKWYKVQLKKVKNGHFDVYINGEKKNVQVSKADDLKFMFNEDSEILFTSLVGIKDSSYKEPTPDYISSKYKAIAPSLAIEGQPIKNYDRLDKTSGAKTYSYTSEQWGEIGFGEIEIAKYSKLTFFLHKADYDTANWLELYKKDKEGNKTYYIQKNTNKWFEIVLKKNSKGKFEVYVNDEKQKGTISDISELKVCINGNSTLHYTTICGIVDSNYKEPEPEYISNSYKPIAPAVAVQASEMENYVLVSKISGAKTYTYTADQWGARDLPDIEFAPYKNLVFFIKKADLKTSNWIEFYKKGNTNKYYIQNNGNSWYKIELKKVSNGTFDLYVDGVKKDSSLSKASQLKVCVNGGSTIYFTSLFAIDDENYKEPEAEVRGIMAAMQPWAYGKAVSDNTKTAKTLGYEYATVIDGSNDTYAGALMSDVDLSEYKSFRFALKSTDSAWWEIGYASINTWNMTNGNSSSWVEYEFKNEGNGKFVMYKDGEKSSITISDSSNLSELQMKFGASGKLYMTELRGELKDNVSTNVKKVATSFNDYTGTYTDTEKPVRYSNGSTIADTVWSPDKFAMKDVDLTKYKKVLFYAKKTDGDAWFETTVFGSCQLTNSWTEFKLTKNKDKTWNLYRAGKLCTEKLSITNLSEIQAGYGSATYVFSEVFAIEDSESQQPEENKTWGTMLANSPWAYGNGTVSDSSTWKDGGYEYANVISGSNDSYSGRLMSDVDLSIYSEIRFALKSDGTSWYEIGKVADDNFSMIANNTSEWVEIKFVDEGNGYFQVYVKKESQTDSGWVNKQISLNSNLSDLQMKFALSGTLVMTEVRGKLREDVTNPLKKLMDCVRAGGEVVTDIFKPINEISTISKMTTSWTQGFDEALPDIKLDNYKMIKFYVKNTVGQSAYIEMQDSNSSGYIAGNVIDNWTEVKFVRNSDDTWKIVVAGQTNDTVKKLNITNLNQIKVKYGSNTWHMTDVLGVEK